MGKLRIIVGDIVNDEILLGHDAIVNPTNPQMVAGAGVSGAIFKKAGVERLEEYTQKEFGINYFSDDYNIDNMMKVGEVRITPGFNLDMDIIFVQGPTKWEFDNSLDVLLDTYTNLLKEIEKKNYKNVLVPSLGTGHYGFMHEEVSKVVIPLIKNYIKDKDINIDFVVYDNEDKYYYESYL